MGGGARDRRRGMGEAEPSEMEVNGGSNQSTAFNSNHYLPNNQGLL